MHNIRSHKELADHIAGKRVLHMNSLGKDAALSLEWLANYAHPSHIVSVHFSFIAKHPDDERYLEYLRKRYPHVEFVVFPNANEINILQAGLYQQPFEREQFYMRWEHYDFERMKQADEIQKYMKLDFLCQGQSKYESFARAVRFYQRGLIDGDVIFPLGLMSKAEVWGLIKSSGLKLHPCYKMSKSTYDFPSYWKMRSAMIAYPDYAETVYKMYPMLALDKYRWEKLLNDKT